MRHNQGPRGWTIYVGGGLSMGVGGVRGGGVR